MQRELKAADVKVSDKDLKDALNPQTTAATAAHKKIKKAETPLNERFRFSIPR